VVQAIFCSEFSGGGKEERKIELGQREGMKGERNSFSTVMDGEVASPSHRGKRRKLEEDGLLLLAEGRIKFFARWRRRVDRKEKRSILRAGKEGCFPYRSKAERKMGRRGGRPISSWPRSGEERSSTLRIGQERRPAYRGQGSLLTQKEKGQQGDGHPPPSRGKKCPLLKEGGEEARRERSFSLRL